MQHKLILFDGVCNFCSFWVNFVIKRDKNDIFRFAALQSETGMQYLKLFGINITDPDTFVLIEGKEYFIKSTAALKVAWELKSWLKISYPLIFLPISFRDFLYDLIAKNRYKIFGKKDVCRIPTAEEKMKFI